VIIVALRGCHLLDGLVACLHPKAHKKHVLCSEEELCEGCCTRPIGDVKRNSSRARYEEHQVV
jgi:hypothetical protein